MKYLNYFFTFLLIQPLHLSQAAFTNLPVINHNRQRGQFNDMLKGPLSFNHNIEVNANLGTFKTSIPIKLPPNLLGLNHLNLNYNSFESRNLGLGIGFNLDLPVIINNTHSPQRPFKFYGLLGAGELVRVNESLETLGDHLDTIIKSTLLKKAKQKRGQDQYQLIPFRPHIDKNFHLFVQVKEGSKFIGWIVLQLDGKRWIIDRDGFTIQLRDIFNNKIDFSWETGALRSVSYPDWSLKINYIDKNQHWPIVHHNKLHYLPKGIKSIKYLEGEKENSKLIFKYDDEYLTDVRTEGGQFSLFQGNYANSLHNIPDSVKIEANNIKKHDDQYPVFESIGRKPSLKTFSPGKDEVIRYSDLNGDGISDKIVIDYSPLHEFIAPSKMASAKVEVLLSLINDGELSFVKEGRMSLPSNYYRPIFSTQTRKEGDYTIHHYKFDGWSHEMFLVDLDGNGKKDVVYCPSDGSLDENVHKLAGDQYLYRGKKRQRAFSNLHLQILKDLKGTPEIQNIRFTNPLKSTGSTPVVLIQKSDTKQVEKLFELFKGQKFNTARLLNTSYWEKSDGNFKCNQHSIFHDFNGDGYPDVLTGKKLYLRSPLGQNIIINIKNLSTLFELGDREFDLTSTDISFADIDNDNKLEIYQARSIYSDPLSGRINILRLGESKSHIPGPKRNLLTRIVAPLGGTININYKFIEGRWVVEKLEKNPIHTNPVKTRTFDYQTSIKDPLTGIFTGFYKIREIIKESHSQITPTIIESIYSKDLDSSSLVFNSRPRLRGLLLKELITPKGEKGQQKMTIQRWDAVDLGHGRIFPFVSKKEEKLREDNRQYLTSKKTLSSHLFKNNTPHKKRLTIKGHGLNSSDHDDLLDGVKTVQKDFQFFPSLYKQVIKKISLLGKNNKKLRPDRTFPQFNKYGQILQSCQGDRCSKHWYDKRGRIITFLRSNAFKQDVTYIKNSPLARTVQETISGDTISKSFQYDFLGRNIFYQNGGLMIYTKYNRDGLPKKMIRKAKGAENVEIFKAHLNPVSREVDLKESGISIKVVLDGFGKMVGSSYTKEGKMFFGGKRVVASDGKLLQHFLPSFNRPSDHVHIENFYDHLGRITYEKKGGLNVHYTYQGPCIHKVTNDRHTFNECKDSLGNVVVQGPGNELIRLRTNALGDILSISDLGLTWNYDKLGNITKSIGSENLTADSPSWISMKKSRSSWGLIESNENGFTKYFNHFGGLLGTFRAGTAHKTDLYEQVKHTNNLLREHVFKNNVSEEVISKSIQYGPLLLPSLVTVNDMKISLDYDDYGKLISKDYQYRGDPQSQLVFSYRNGDLKSIHPVVEDLQKDHLSNITKISFESGLVLERIFETNSHKISSITASSSHKIQFQETVERDDIFQIIGRSTKSTLGSNESLDFTYNPSNYQLLSDQKVLPHERNERGQVDKIGDSQVYWNDQNLSSIVKGNQSFYFFYDSNGAIRAACPSMKGPPVQDFENCLIIMSEDNYTYQGQLINVVKAEGVPIAVIFNKKIFPIVTDHLGSVRAMFNPQDSSLLWERSYSAWGIKSVKYTNNQELLPLAKKLEKLTVWSFAGLIEMPFNFKNSDSSYYWSKSRVYSPQIREWLSVDPLLQWNPGMLLSKPGNWYGVRYAGNDPVNLVDPSGYAAGDIWLYRSDGTIGSRSAHLSSWIADSFKSGPYSHASIEINGNRQYTANISHGANAIIANRDILENLDGNKGRIIDIYRHKSSDKFDADKATNYAEIMNKNGGEYFFDGWCSKRAHETIMAGGLNTGDHGAFSTPNDFYRDSNFNHVGRHDTNSQISMEIYQ